MEGYIYIYEGDPAKYDEENDFDCIHRYLNVDNLSIDDLSIEDLVTKSVVEGYRGKSGSDMIEPRNLPKTAMVAVYNEGAWSTASKTDFRGVKIEEAKVGAKDVIKHLRNFLDQLNCNLRTCEVCEWVDSPEDWYKCDSCGAPICTDCGHATGENYCCDL